MFLAIQQETHKWRVKYANVIAQAMSIKQCHAYLPRQPTSSLQGCQIAAILSSQVP